MRNFFSEYKKPAISAIVFFMTLMGMSYAYAAFTALTNVVAGGQLKAVDWNAMVADLNDLNGRSVPQGAVMAFFWTSCPTNWSPADGTANGVKKTDGTSGTLDLRGEFIRGLDGGRGIDPSRTLGSFQGDAIRNITGQFGNGFYGEIGSTNATGVFVADGSAGNTKYTSAGWTSNGPLIDFDASRTVPTASENRPRNVALLYCVKN